MSEPHVHVKSVVCSCGQLFALRAAPSPDTGALAEALADVLRVFDAPFATSPTTRANIRRRAEAAIAATAALRVASPTREEK